LNHLPIIRLAVAGLALVVALASRNRGTVMGSLMLVAVMATSVWPVIKSGESAYNRIRAISDSEGASLLKPHILIADRWAWLYYLTALAAAAAALAAWKRPEKLRWFGIPVALLAAVNLTAGGVVAKPGGEVRHLEFRPGSTLSHPDLPPNHDREHEHAH